MALIAIMYIGERRFQKTTMNNHQQFIRALSNEFDVKVYDFIKDRHDPACPFQFSGSVQVWDFTKGIERIQEKIVIKLRTDVWFTKSAVNVVIQELKKICDNSLELVYLGINLRHHYNKEYHADIAQSADKVMDFIIIARTDKLKPSQDILNSITDTKKAKSGNKFFKLLMLPETNAISISCQLYLIRKEYANPENWQILNDWAAEYRKTDSGLDWIENSRDIINKF